MMFPLEFGLGHFGAESLSEEAKNTLKRLQGRGGYSDAEDSARVLELLAWGTVLGVSAATLEAVDNNAFADKAHELLTDWEEAKRLPNDLPRTKHERQKRLALLSAAKTAGNANAISALIQSAIPGAQLLTHSPADEPEKLGDADPASRLQLALKLPDWSAATRRQATFLLRRLLPSWCYGAHLRGQHHSTAEGERFPQGQLDGMLVLDADARWGATNRELGKTALARVSAAPTHTLRPPSRVRSYGELSRVDLIDLQEIQRAVQYHAQYYTTPASGVRVHSRFFAVEVPASSTVQIMSGDYRGCLAKLVVRYRVDDIRPGEADQDSLNASTRHASVWYTGTSTAYNRTVGDLNFAADDVEFTVNNSNVTDDIWVVGYVEFVFDSNYIATDTIITGDTLAGCDAAWWTAVADSAAVGAADGDDAAVWAGFPAGVRGGIVRAGVAHLDRPGSGANSYLLDNTINWRDRLLCVYVFPQTDATKSYYPGITDDPSAGDDQWFRAEDDDAAILGFTGDGVALGSASLDGFHLEDALSGARLCASDSSSDNPGMLYIEYPASASTAQAAIGYIIIASDKLTGTAATNLATPVDGNAMLPWQFNHIQDIGVCSPFRRNQLSWSNRKTEPGAVYPVGNILDQAGYPRFVRSRENHGRARLGSIELREPQLVMQYVAGRLRCTFSVEANPDDVFSIHPQLDFRDRLVSFSVAYSTADNIVPDESGDDMSTATFVTRSVYVGAVGSVPSSRIYIDSDLYFFVESDGVLKFRNADVATVSVVAMIEASFKFGV